MIRAVQLIFAPAGTWEKIVLASRGFVFIFFVNLLPLVAVTSAAESWGMFRWGESRNEFGHIVTIPAELAVRYGVATSILGLLLALVSSRFLLSVARSFDAPATFTQAFTTMAYGLGPVYLARFIDAFPAINTWVCWAIGVVVSISLLYHGVGMVMKPEQTKGFGLYIFTTVFVIVLSGLAHFLALSLLHGKLLR